MLCIRNNGLRQPVAVDFPMYKFFINGDKVDKNPMRQTMFDTSQIDARNHKEQIERRTKILEKIVLARKNNFLRPDRHVDAKKKLELNVHRQLPT